MLQVKQQQQQQGSRVRVGFLTALNNSFRCHLRTMLNVNAMHYLLSVLAIGMVYIVGGSVLAQRITVMTNDVCGFGATSRESVADSVQLFFRTWSRSTEESRIGDERIIADYFHIYVNGLLIVFLIDSMLKMKWTIAGIALIVPLYASVSAMSCQAMRGPVPHMNQWMTVLSWDSMDVFPVSAFLLQYATSWMEKEFKSHPVNMVTRLHVIAYGTFLVARQQATVIGVGLAMLVVVTARAFTKKVINYIAGVMIHKRGRTVVEMMKMGVFEDETDDLVRAIEREDQEKEKEKEMEKNNIDLGLQTDEDEDEKEREFEEEQNDTVEFSASSSSSSSSAAAAQAQAH